MIFQRFISRHIPGLRILPVSMKHYVPGILLDAKKLHLMGHCRDLLPEEPEVSWVVHHSEASIVYGMIAASRKLGGGAHVLGVISLSGRLSDDLRIRIDISDIRGAYLGINQLQLHPKINNLRRIDRWGRWRQANGRFVVLESFYACRFEATFYKKNQLISRAELDQITRINIHGNLKYLWKADKTLVISNNNEVPFGVRGFVV